MESIKQRRVIIIELNQVESIKVDAAKWKWINYPWEPRSDYDEFINFSNVDVCFSLFFSFFFFQTLTSRRGTSSVYSEFHRGGHETKMDAKSVKNIKIDCVNISTYLSIAFGILTTIRDHLNPNKYHSRFAIVSSIIYSISRGYMIVYIP